MSIFWKYRIVNIELSMIEHHQKTTSLVVLGNSCGLDLNSSWRKSKWEPWQSGNHENRGIESSTSAKTHHSCAEGYGFPFASVSISRSQSSSTTPSMVRSNISQLHLYSCLRGQPQCSPAICCMRWPNCASNQDPSLRVKMTGFNMSCELPLDPFCDFQNGPAFPRPCETNSTGSLYPERVDFKLCPTIYKVHNSAPQYLIELCIPVATLPGRCHLPRWHHLSIITKTIGPRGFFYAGPVAFLYNV